jgi:tRNA (guanine37-N1)-methyltransferase
LEGHHEKIRQWRKKQALARTQARRPDLLKGKTLDREEEQLLEEVQSEIRGKCAENGYEHTGSN